VRLHAATSKSRNNCALVVQSTNSEAVPLACGLRDHKHDSDNIKAHGCQISTSTLTSFLPTTGETEQNLHEQKPCPAQEFSHRSADSSLRRVGRVRFHRFYFQLSPPNDYSPPAMRNDLASDAKQSPYLQKSHYDSSTYQRVLGGAGIQIHQNPRLR